MPDKLLALRIYEVLSPRETSRVYCQNDLEKLRTVPVVIGCDVKVRHTRKMDCQIRIQELQEALLLLLKDTVPCFVAVDEAPSRAVALVAERYGFLDDMERQYRHTCNRQCNVVRGLILLSTERPSGPR